MTKPLSEQVAELEAERDELTRKNTLASWKANSLRFDHDSLLRQLFELENRADVMRAERDDLQRQVQEARDENDALWAGQGRWPRLGPATAPTVPRLITADELREGQTVAVWTHDTQDVRGGIVTKLDYKDGRLDRLEVNYGRSGHCSGHGEKTVVLLADAPQPTGYADDDHQADPVTAETIRNSEPGSTWDWFPANEPSSTWEFDGQSMRLHHQDGDISGYVPLEEMVRYRFTRSTAAPRGTYTQPRLTVHDLEVAPVGSRLSHARSFIMPKQKAPNGKWVTYPASFYEDGVFFDPEELIAKGWDDATLTTPETQ